MTPARRRKRRGSVMMQALIAAAILTTTLAGITSMWYISFNITARSDELGVAYMIGRRQFEVIKQNGYQTGGFQLPLDGTTNSYFDAAGNAVSADASSRMYQASVSLSTSSGLQTATVTVTLVSNAAQMYQASTYLVKAGV